MREACFSRCEGVTAWETSEPCVDGALALCLGYALVDPKARVACPVDAGDSQQVLDVAGQIFGLAFQVARLAVDEEDEEQEEWEEPRTRDPVPGSSKQSVRTPSYPAPSSSASARPEWSTKPSDGPSPASKFGTSSKLRGDD